jgi:hypothetical protein
MTCPVFCGGGAVYLQPGDGSAPSALYYTPFLQPPSAAVAGVATGSSGELWTVGYDATGGYLQQLRPGSMQLRYGAAMTAAVVLPSGAVVVAGTTGAAGFVRRYSAAGVVDWTTSTTGAKGCSKLALGAADQIGCLSSVAGQARRVVDLLAPTGAPVRMGLASGVNDITIDATGNLWAAGVGCGGTCASLQKFDANGLLIATALVDDPARTSEWRAVSAGPNGDVYTTGISRPLSVTMIMPSDMITARHSSNGVQQWLALINGKADLNDEGVSVVATADGAIVAGNVTDVGTYLGPDSYTVLVVKYGAATLIAPALTLVSTPDPAQAGKPLTLTATVSGASAPSGTVTFSEGAAVLCASVSLVATAPTTAAASCTVATVIGGSRQFIASYSGDATFAGTSMTVAVVVMAGAALDIPALSPALLVLLSTLLLLLAVRETRSKK